MSKSIFFQPELPCSLRPRQLKVLIYSQLPRARLPLPVRALSGDAMLLATCVTPLSAFETPGAPPGLRPPLLPRRGLGACGAGRERRRKSAGCAQPTGGSREQQPRAPRQRGAAHVSPLRTQVTPARPAAPRPAYGPAEHPPRPEPPPGKGNRQRHSER